MFAFVAKSSRTVVVPKLKQGSTTATCPRGEHVSSGGAIGQFRPPVGSGPAMFPEGMRRTAGNKWTVYGLNDAPLTGSRLTSVAYCDHGAIPTVAQQTVTLPGGKLASAIATCPAGSVVVGAGYNSAAAPGHLEILVRLGLLSPRQLVVSMGNFRPVATKLTAIAYCGHGAAPTEAAAALTLGAHEGGTVRVSCPSGTSIVFGGVVANSPGTSRSSFADLAPFSWSAASTKQWVVTGFNAGNLAGTLFAIAYCR